MQFIHFLLNEIIKLLCDFRTESINKKYGNKHVAYNEKNQFLFFLSMIIIFLIK
jgi:hypothetical protein